MEHEFEQLEKSAIGCTKCNLSKSRTQVVFGEGNVHAGIMLIGEGPGYYEDELGRPFVGPSGELLDKILGACGFTRWEHVYIANIVKCRPPQNREPLPEERQACLPYLKEQIRLIDPDIIVLLGATALKGLISADMKISEFRGKWIDWENRNVMPTYHPAALLRNPSLKKDSWDDFKKVVVRYRELVNPGHYCAFI
jgi:uracil-DNA glycosylase